MPTLVISGSYLAILRPQKGTYYIMGLNPQQTHWLNKSNSARFAGGTAVLETSSLPDMVGQASSIHVSTYAQQTKRLGLISSGKYIRINIPGQNGAAPTVYRIPVFKKTSGLLNWIEPGGPDMTAPPVTQPETYTRPLFTMRADPQPQPAPPPPNLNVNINFGGNGFRPASQLLPKAIPRRIAWLIAEDACKNNQECPISMDAITPITAKVTTCFHVFDGASIDTWLQTHNTCPVCKQTCVATAAFVEEESQPQQSQPQEQPIPMDVV